MSWEYDSLIKNKSHIKKKKKKKEKSTAPILINSKRVQ